MGIEVTALIVEDEVKASQALKDLIEMVAPDVNVIGVETNVQGAVTCIEHKNPMLVFLDVQLGNQHSFEILKRLPAKNFQIIFITAYSDYAIEAFRFSAVDYLLKPVDPTMLEAAIIEAIRRIKEQRTTGNLQTLLENLQSGEKPKKIVLTTLDFVHVVDIREIIKCQSSINYTVFHLVGGKEIVVSKTLKEFDEQLSPHGFFRVHKSWLINVSHVKGYDRKGGGVAIMQDESAVPVSLAKKEIFMEVLKSFF